MNEENIELEDSTEEVIEEVEDTQEEQVEEEVKVKEEFVTYFSPSASLVCYVDIMDKKRTSFSKGQLIDVKRKIKFVNGRYRTKDKEEIKCLDAYCKKRPGLASKIDINVTKLQNITKAIASAKDIGDISEKELLEAVELVKKNKSKGKQGAVGAS